MNDSTQPPRYRLHTTGAGDGRAIGHESWPYRDWRAAYRAAANYSQAHGLCVVQSDRVTGPRDNQHVVTLAVFRYGQRAGR
jgi:hypothetical protein